MRPETARTALKAYAAVLAIVMLLSIAVAFAAPFRGLFAMAGGASPGGVVILGILVVLLAPFALSTYAASLIWRRKARQNALVFLWVCLAENILFGIIAAGVSASWAFLVPIVAVAALLWGGIWLLNADGMGKLFGERSA